jgi:hypothetical protein
MRSARGGSRTRTAAVGQRILSPPRLPFRHPGPAKKKRFVGWSLCRRYHDSLADFKADDAVGGNLARADGQFGAEETA